MAQENAPPSSITVSIGMASGGPMKVTTGMFAKLVSLHGIAETVPRVLAPLRSHHKEHERHFFRNIKTPLSAEAGFLLY